MSVLPPPPNLERSWPIKPFTKEQTLRSCWRASWKSCISGESLNLSSVCVYFSHQTEHTSYTFRLCGNKQNTHSHGPHPISPPHRPPPLCGFTTTDHSQDLMGGGETAERSLQQSQPGPQNSHTKEPHHSHWLPTDTSCVYTGLLCPPVGQSRPGWTERLRL